MHHFILYLVKTSKDFGAPQKSGFRSVETGEKREETDLLPTTPFLIFRFYPGDGR